MTALLPDRETRGETTRSAAEVSHDLRHRRPLVLVAGLAGVLAAAGTLTVCLAVGVAGWFLTDAGAHGAPRDGLRTGALGLADGARLGRPRRRRAGHRHAARHHARLCVGDLADGAPARRLDLGPRPGRRPDRRRRARLDRAGGRAGLHERRTSRRRCSPARLASTPSTAPDLVRVVLWSVVHLRAVRGHRDRGRLGPGRGLGGLAPRVAGRHRGRVPLRAHHLGLGVPGVLRRRAGARPRHRPQPGLPARHRRRGRRRCSLLVSLVLVPNAMAVLRRLPPRPRVHGRRADDRLAGRGHRRRRCPCSRCSRRCRTAARRRAGRPGWSWCRRSSRRSAWPGPSGAARRCATRRVPCTAAPAGCSPGRRSASWPSLAGGAVGPGRMTDVGPLVGSVLVHGVTAFGIGGLLGGLAMTWWQTARRRARRGHGSLDSTRACAPGRARLRGRHQPPGAARREPPTRRTAPRWSPSAPTATASRGWPGPSGRASRPSCTGSRTTRTARPGTGR